MGEAVPRAARGLAAGPPRIVREGIWVGLGQAASVLAGLVGVRLLTELLPPAVYGEVALLLGLGVLGAGLLCSPFLQAALRFYPDARAAGKVGVLRRMAGRTLLLGAAAIAVLLLLGGAVRGPFASFAAVGAIVACDTWRSFESNLLNGERRQRDYTVRTALDGWARWLAAAALVWWLGPQSLPALAGFALGSAAVGFLLRRRTVRGEPPPADWAADPWARSRRSPFLHYALPLVPLAALNWVLSLGDRYVLAAAWSTGAAGIYVAAYGLASQPFIAVNTMIHTTLRPVLYDAVEAGDAAKERRTLRLWVVVVLVVMGLGFAGMVLLAPLLCALLLGPRYQAAAALLPWIAGAYALQALQQTFEIMMYAHGQTRRLAGLQALAAGASAVLYLVLIPRHGALGAAMATVATFALTTLAACLLAAAPRRLRGAPAPSC